MIVLSIRSEVPIVLSRRWSCRALVTFLLVGVAAAAPAQSPSVQPDALTVAQAEEQVRAIRAALKQSPDRSEGWDQLMVAETVVLHLRAQKAEAEGTSIDQAALRGQQQVMRERVLAEWKAARPNDPTPYLAEMQSSLPEDRIDEAVLELLPRFPDDSRLLGRVVQILLRRQEAKRATELAEAALARHPDRSELYSVAIGAYMQLMNETRQRELAEAWIDRLPGDPNALRNWLSLPSPARDPRESADRVERFVGAGGGDARRVDVCGWLLTVEQGTHREAATRCLTAAAEQARDVEVQARARGFLAGVAGASGDEREMARSLAQVPPARRLEAVLHAVEALGADDCPRIIELLDLLPWDGTDTGGKDSTRFSALRECRTWPAVRAGYLEALRRGAPAAELDNLLSAWFIRMNGFYLDNNGLGSGLATALEERLRREKDQVEVWRALATAYEIAGQDERRAAHLAAWLATDLAPPYQEQLAWFAGFQAGHGGDDAAVAALRQAWSKTKDTSVGMELGDLLIATGRTNDLATLIGELTTPGPNSLQVDPWRASLARLLRGREALVRQGPQAALEDYQAWVDTTGALILDEAAEYLLVVAGARGENAVQPAAEALCAKKSSALGRTPEECAASLLAELGHAEGALELLEKSAERAPENLGFQLTLALAAERSGDLNRAEQAYRRILAADPKSQGAWTGLARLQERRGDPAALETWLRQAEAALGEQPPEIVLSVSRAYMAHGQAARAVEILKALRLRHPDNGLGQDELEAAYRLVAQQTPVTAETTAGPGPVAPPTSEDLRAEREAEAALLGLGGPMDEARGRETVKTLAHRGNAYANVRLAIWQHGGSQGFEQNPRQAAATVAPYLAPLRAAAEAGEGFAQYLWGTVLLRGLGVAKNPAEAAVWLRKAADRNEPWALHNLGYMAEHEGDDPNLGEALRWYRRGAEAGNPHSMVSLATLLLGEESSVRQPAEGSRWLARAAEKGLPEAVSWYGAFLLYGHSGVPADPVRARPWLEKAAATGDLRGIYELGVTWLLGAGGPQDEARAVKLFEQAAERGYTLAVWQLAWQSALGRGTPRDAARVDQWIERAAALAVDDPSYILGARELTGELARRYFLNGLRELDQRAAAGDALAGGLLARLYLTGNGVPQDDARAVAYARPAAAAGSALAMRVLGSAYRLGGGVEKDPVQAADWMRRGAEAGNSFCMMWYSQMLFDGKGGRKDAAEALAWLERSGEKGNAWAVRDLGHLYDEGWNGIPRDEKKAAVWKRKALAFNDDEARGWLIAHGMAE